MRNKFLFFLLGCFFSLIADEIEFKASVNAQKIGIDDMLTYTVTYRGIQNAPQPDISAMKDFSVTQASQSTEFRFVNGMSSHYTNFVFYLMPTRTGNLTIPEVTFNHQGVTYRTEPFEIEVVKGSTGVQPPSGQERKSLLDEDFFTSPFDRNQQTEIDVRLEPWTSEKKILRGQGLLFKVLLYTRNRIESINLISGQSFPGFWQEWYPIPRSIDGVTIEKNGRTYQVYEIRKVALFPSKSGILTIPAFKFEVNLTDQAFSFFSSPRKVFRESPPVEIQVSELPPDAEGLPVGDFTFQIDPEKKEVDVNDILTVKMNIQGQGNLKTLVIPEFTNNDFYQVYPAKITRNYEYDKSMLSGTLTGEIPVAFKSTGRVSLPSLEFAYYSPKMKTINRLISPPMVIRVTGTKEKAEGAMTIQKSEILKKAEDIDFIKKGKIRNQGKKIYRSWLFALVFILPFVLNLFFILKIMVVDKIFLQSKILNKRILLNYTIKKLKNVKDRGEIHIILENYLQKKIGLGFSEIRNDNIETFFKKVKISDYDIEAFLQCKSESESSRFSPEKKSLQDLKKDIYSMVAILKRIDRKLK